MLQPAIQVATVEAAPLEAGSAAPAPAKAQDAVAQADPPVLLIKAQSQGDLLGPAGVSGRQSDPLGGSQNGNPARMSAAISGGAGR
jgi:hypothetical protein